MGLCLCDIYSKLGNLNVRLIIKGDKVLIQLILLVEFVDNCVHIHLYSALVLNIVDRCGSTCNAFQ